MKIISKFKTFINSSFLVLTITSFVLFSQQLHAKGPSKTKIVYPLDFVDVKRVHFMINTLNNLVKHYQDNLIDYEISVVAYGPGVQYMLTSDKASGFKIMPYINHGGPTGNGTAGRLKALKQLAGDAIEFYVCGNTMKKKKVSKEMLFPYTKVTPAGVLKVIQLQQEGAAVIKIR